MESTNADEVSIFNVARLFAFPDVRCSYLDQSCAGDRALRERVEKLLCAYDQEPGFLEAPATEVRAVSESPPGERPGAQIGAYKLLEQIGEGGFGVVFMARRYQAVERDGYARRGSASGEGHRLWRGQGDCAAADGEDPFYRIWPDGRYSGVHEPGAGVDEPAGRRYPLGRLFAGRAALRASDGSTPIESTRLRDAGFAEIQRLITDEEPQRPSTRLSSLADTATIVAGNRATDPKHLFRQIAGDLDWIVMKALVKDRNRRYPSPGAFAEGIERFLRREPVVARPPSLVYRVIRFADRHRGAVVAASAIALALLAGTTVAAWQAVIATRAKHDAQAAAAAEHSARQKAVAKEAETQAILKFVEDKIFAAARPKGRYGGLGPGVSLHAAIDAAVPFVGDSFKDQPLTEARRRQTLGVSYRDLGDEKAAEKQFEPAQAIFTKLLGRDDRSTLIAMTNLANSYHFLHRYGEALELRKTIELYKAQYGPDDYETLMTMHNIGANLRALGRYADALKVHEETRKRRTATLGADHPDTVTSLWSIAHDLIKLDRGSDAVPLLDECLERAVGKHVHQNFAEVAASGLRIFEFKMLLADLEKEQAKRKAQK